MSKRKKYTKKEDEIIKERAHHRCEYCQWYRKYSNASFDKDHIEPLIRGGAEKLYNIAYSCRPCNGSKHTKTEGFDEVTQTIAPLYHPRQQRWLDHFRWSEDSLRIIGITPTGRVTVNILKMNREELVYLRKVFRDMGKHPPTEY